jgi:hypothetical protein
MKSQFILVVTAIFTLSIFLVLGGGYIYWNAAEPETTCMSCHEISPSVTAMHNSAHRDINCKACHGTALSNGLHSIKEKANMIFTHLGNEVQHTDIQMDEQQVLEMSDRCAGCHQMEHAGWLAGGHATTYKDIFLDSVHNSMEPPYADCFRCHGMYYEGTISDLVEPLSTNGPWRLKDESKLHDPTIPCLSCHQVHTDNNTLESTLTKKDRYPPASLFVRAGKMHIRADLMTKSQMYYEGEEVKVSDDYYQSLCLNCHAPNAFHEVGSQDDKTPIGVHEGLGCISCHEPHSNDASNSCAKCHPAISNCGMDVNMMNTSHFDPNSPNDIHFVSCADCHDDMSLN